MEIHAGVARGVLLVDGLPGFGFFRERGPVLEQGFRELIDQLLIGVGGADQVRGTHVHAREIIRDAFVSASGNGCRAEEGVFLDQVLFDLGVIRNEGDVHCRGRGGD